MEGRRKGRKKEMGERRGREEEGDRTGQKERKTNKRMRESVGRCMEKGKEGAGGRKKI